MWFSELTEQKKVHTSTIPQLAVPQAQPQPQRNVNERAKTL